MGNMILRKNTITWDGLDQSNIYTALNVKNIQ